MKAKSKVKAKAAGKAKAAASKAPGVTSSPMKAQEAKAKSTMKKILTRPDAAEGESQGKAKTVKEMAAGWKKTRDEPVPDDHAEGEDEEPKEEDATVADDEHRSYPKVRKCARMIKSGQVPEDLQQLYEEEGSKNSPPPRLFKSQFINTVFQQNTRGESVFAPGNTQCSKFSRRTLRFATNLRLLGWLRLWTKSRETSKFGMMQKDEVMSIRKMVTIMSRQ